MVIYPFLPFFILESHMIKFSYMKERGISYINWALHLNQFDPYLVSKYEWIHEKKPTVMGPNNEKILFLFYLKMAPFFAQICLFPAHVAGH